jgi:hypothetical protein
MEAIISSILGAVVGGVIAWLVSRRKPHHIICDEDYRGVFNLEVPETSIMFRGAAVEELGLLRLKFRNNGSQTIEKPNIVVRVDKDIKILDTKLDFFPERIDLKFEENSESQSDKGKNNIELPVKTIIDKNSVEIKLDRIIPYSTNQETVSLDIFTEGETEKMEVLGSGALKDGTAWAVIFKPWEEVQRKLSRRVSLLSLFSILISLILLLIYVFKLLPTNFLSVSTWDNFKKWLNDPLLWIFSGWLILTIAGHLYGGFKGIVMMLPIPFSEKALYLNISRRRKSKKAS